jgi:Hypothetical glycosyl hydrolase family 15
VIAFQTSVYGKHSASAGEDAIAADNVTLQNIQWGRCGIFRNGNWVPRNWVPLHYFGPNGAQKFATDVVNWAHELRPQLHSLSPPRILIVDLACYDLDQTPIALTPIALKAFLQRFFHEVDGILEEGGFFDCYQQKLSGGNWVRKILMIRDIQKLGLPYYAVNGYGQTQKSYSCKTDAPNVPADFREWSIASYLMAKEHSAALYISRALEYGCALWYPEYGAKVGHPCGEMYEAQNVYMRDYSKALIIVNPTPTGTFKVNHPAKVNLPAGRKFVNLRGNIVSSPITLPNLTGLVLLTVGKPDLCP